MWTIRGTIKFTGQCNFYFGSYVLVSDGALLSIASRTLFGSGVKIICFDRIEFGDTFRCTWECQIMDSSFHYIRLRNKDNVVRPLTKPIITGDYVWVGNRCSIMKGTVIPSHSIVASNSVVNKDYSDLPPYSLLAGCPAQFKGDGYERIFDENEQAELDAKFGYVRTHL